MLSNVNSKLWLLSYSRTVCGRSATHRSFSNEAEVSSLKGFVGGCALIGKREKRLTPACAFLDQTYLSCAIKNNLSNYQLFNRCRDPELFYSIFEQQRFAIVISPFAPKSGIHFKSTSGLRRLSQSYLGRHLVRQCVGTGIQALQRRGIRDIFVDPCDDPEVAAEGAYLAAFVYDELKSTSRQTLKPHITCYTNHLDVSSSADMDKDAVLAAWNRGTHLAMAQNLARKWMEMPANILSPIAFANQAASVLEGLTTASLRVQIHNADWCREHGLNGLLAVGAGSHRSVVFLEIVYEGDPAHTRDHIALVGKGVTFDSGGISIKPSAGMEDMRADMGGAAVVVATIFGLANLQVPVNIRAYIPLCENMPGGGAMRPGDVVHMASGLSVQVDNTDAEGRLILADALHMAHRHPDLPSPPALIIDVATLTGAISVALGDEFTGVFMNMASRQLRTNSIWARVDGLKDLQYVNSSHTADATSDNSSDSGSSSESEDEDDDEEVEETAEELSSPDSNGLSLLECLRVSAAARGDRVWNMPLLHTTVLRDQAHLADLVNVPKGEYAGKGGSGFAGSFLNAFVPRSIPWIHMDIAGVMKRDARDGYIRRGMAGRPTRTLIEFLQRLSRH